MSEKQFDSALQVKNLEKKYKNFELKIENLDIPKGFTTALIGENGAGKTTLLELLAGIRLRYQGEICYFGEYVNDDRDKPENEVRENIGYTATGDMFLPHWTVKQVREISELLFERFHPEQFERLCKELDILGKNGEKQKVKDLSDGTRIKLMLASVLARDTKLLLMDEPTSPLDPLMREKLCRLLQDYLEEGQGEKTVLFSTHNISDMESITDYCVFLEHGRVVERGFVEDLKEKYVLVKGERRDLEKVKPVLYDLSEGKYGFEGICLAEALDQLAGLPIAKETASLFRISVAILKKHTKMQ